MFNIDFSKITSLLKFDPADPLLFGSSLFLILFFLLILFYRIFASSKNARILLLLFFSLFFYYKASGIYFLLLIASAAVNFAFGKFIFDAKSSGIRRLLLVINVILNIGMLGYFKYTNFFIEIINDLKVGTFDPIDIFLPLGISFYTFKAMNYVLDIYLEAMEPTKSFRDFSLFVFFFPNILAGPIDRAAQFIPQIEQNELIISKEDIGKALLLIMSGLLKKVVIADYLSLNFVDRVFDSPLRFTGVENLFALYGYGLQIYCDFSGYSDIAIGISLLLGFKLMDNFNSPYQATSIADFWRRWHISLSSWLLDYLFRPIQMKFRDLKMFGNVIAILVTFVLCGLWHGASWMFVFWGLLHGFYMSVSMFLQKPKRLLYQKLGILNSKVLRVFQVLITFHLLAVSWVFFRVKSFEEATNIFSQIFNFFDYKIIPQFIEGYTPSFLLIVLGYTIHFLPKSFEIKSANILAKINPVFQALILAFVIWFAAQVRSAELQPFIYFQF
jgi:D-alanyl-lipoteichoic acid acyltransferase DltB (MBOAT superfamily)